MYVPTSSILPPSTYFKRHTLFTCIQNCTNLQQTRTQGCTIVDSAVVRAKATPRKVEKGETRSSYNLYLISSPAALHLLHHTETLENHGPGSLDAGGFSKATYGYL